MEWAVAGPIVVGLVGCLVVLARAGWGLVCSHKAHDQRLRLIDWAFADPRDYRRRKAMLHAVDYDKHCRELERFRDPWQLYDPEVRAAMTAPAPEQGGG